MCVVLLAAHLCSLTPSREGGYLAETGGSNMLASLANFCATNTRSERLNTWILPAAKSTFDWTSAVRSVTTTDSVPWWKTNIEKL